VDAAAVHQHEPIVRIAHERRVEIGFRPLQFAELIVDDATVVINGCVIRIERQRLVEYAQSFR
jgi:hypothetical protein